MRGYFLAAIALAPLIATFTVSSPVAAGEEMSQSNPPPSNDGSGGRDCEKKKQEPTTS